MFLFLVASPPLLFCLVTFLPGACGRHRTHYDGFLLYLSCLQRDHLFPLVAVVGGFLMLQK